MIFWAEALRFNFGGADGTGRPNKIEKKRAPLDSPLQNHLSRISGWCRSLNYKKAPTTPTPGLSFRVRSVDVIGKTPSRSSWRATILLIYEQKTCSLFHHALANSNKGPITDKLLWRALAKAADTLKKKSFKYQTIPPEVCSEIATVVMPANDRHQQLGAVYDKIQASLDRSRSSDLKLFDSKAGPPFTSIDPQNWQVHRYSAPPSATYKVNLASIQLLRTAMSETAKDVSGVLASLRRDEVRHHRTESKLSIPAPSWRPIFRRRYVS